MLLAGRREAQVVGSSGCEQLHDMSLFHNLKLKRRKVDSRGSSDGKLNSVCREGRGERGVSLEIVRAPSLLVCPMTR